MEGGKEWALRCASNKCVPRKKLAAAPPPFFAGMQRCNGFPAPNRRIRPVAFDNITARAAAAGGRHARTMRVRRHRRAAIAARNAVLLRVALVRAADLSWRCAATAQRAETSCHELTWHDECDLCDSCGLGWVAEDVAGVGGGWLAAEGRVRGLAPHFHPGMATSVLQTCGLMGSGGWRRWAGG